MQLHNITQHSQHTARLVGVRYQTPDHTVTSDVVQHTTQLIKKEVCSTGVPHRQLGKWTSVALALLYTLGTDTLSHIILSQ